VFRCKLIPIDKGRRTRKKLSPRWSAVLVWFLAFISAETFGSVLISAVATAHGASSVQAYSLSQAGTAVFRAVFLLILSSISVLGLRQAVYKPILKKSRTAEIILIGIALILISNVLIGIQTNGVYKASLLGVLYFMHNGGIASLILGLPIQALYYSSEIVVMNYMYILAKEGWSWHKGPLTSGTIFLIMGWASHHAITKDVFVALDGVVLVLIFYIAYEYAEKSPMASIVMWFAQLIA
jgi:hypothetical protein